LIDYNYYKNIISRKYPNYRFSWEILTDIILQNLQTKLYWLDLGAGSNILIKEQPGAAFALGSDIQIPENISKLDLGPFCLSSVYYLPFQDNSFDFITSRFTFEHLAEPGLALDEIDRVLKPDGRLIIQTTNKFSPTVLISRLIPFIIKKAIFKKIFKDNPSGTFKTFYKINYPSKFMATYGHLKLEKLILTEDMICQSKFLFGITFLLFRLIKLLGADSISNNIIAIYRKAN
jgi:SAM-dependent methyltransferase